MLSTSIFLKRGLGLTIFAAGRWRVIIFVHASWQSLIPKWWLQSTQKPVPPVRSSTDCLRRCSSLMLVCGWFPFTGWCRSAMNPADRASRAHERYG
eukprot:6480393-Amphidinium_carterae.1